MRDILCATCVGFAIYCGLAAVSPAPAPSADSPATPACPGIPECRADTAVSPSPFWPVEGKSGGLLSPDGSVRLRCVLPPELQMKNVGGSDGAGLCVFTSIQMACRLQGIQEMEGFREWMQKRPGGGYPQKVDQMIAAFCKEKGVTPPPYVQVEGADLQVLRRACAAGLPCSVTFSNAGNPLQRYGGSHISHMINCFHADSKWYGVLDNNYIQTPQNLDMIGWLNEQEFAKAYAPGWTVVFLAGAAQPPYPCD